MSSQARLFSFLASRHWFALFTQGHWQGPFLMSDADAEELHISALEASAFGVERGPTVTVKWTGSSWERFR